MVVFILPVLGILQPKIGTINLFPPLWGGKRNLKFFPPIIRTPGGEKPGVFPPIIRTPGGGNFIFPLMWGGEKPAAGGKF